MEYQNIEFQKIRLSNNGGLEVTYMKDGRFHHEKRPDAVDASLLNWLAKLKMHLIRIYGMLAAKSMDELIELTPPEAAHLSTVKDKVRCTSVSLKGSDESGSVVVMGTLTTITGRNIAINTPLINFDNQAYPYAGEMQTECEGLVREAYAYLFEGKTAAPSLTDSEGNPIDDLPFVPIFQEAVSDHFLQGCMFNTDKENEALIGTLPLDSLRSLGEYLGKKTENVQADALQESILKEIKKRKKKEQKEMEVQGE